MPVPMEVLLSDVAAPFSGGGGAFADAVVAQWEGPQRQQPLATSVPSVGATVEAAATVASAFSPPGPSAPLTAHVIARVPAAPVPVRWLLPVVGVPLAGPSLASLPADSVLTQAVQWLCSSSGWQLWRAGAVRMDAGGKSVQTFRESFAAVQREAVALGLTPDTNAGVFWMTDRHAVSRVIDSAGERRIMWRGSERKVGESRLYQFCDAISKTLEFLASREPSLANAAFTEAQSFLRAALRALNLARKKRQRQELQRKSVVGHEQNLTVEQARRVARFVQTQLDGLVAAYRAPERHTEVSLDEDEDDARTFGAFHRDAWWFQSLLCAGWLLFQVGTGAWVVVRRRTLLRGPFLSGTTAWRDLSDNGSSRHDSARPSRRCVAVYVRGASPEKKSNGNRTGGHKPPHSGVAICVRGELPSGAVCRCELPSGRPAAEAPCCP